jgi:cell division protein FtsL
MKRSGLPQRSLRRNRFALFVPALVLCASGTRTRTRTRRIFSEHEHEHEHEYEYEYEYEGAIRDEATTTSPEETKSIP